MYCLLSLTYLSQLECRELHSKPRVVWLSHPLKTHHLLLNAFPRLVVELGMYIQKHHGKGNTGKTELVSACPSHFSHLGSTAMEALHVSIHHLGRHFQRHRILAG